MINREKLVDQLLHDLNDIRTNPIGYVHFLQERKSHCHFSCIRTGDHLIKSLEGIHPINELINDLGIPISSRPLKWSFALHTAADIFSHDLGSSGRASHIDSKGHTLKKRLSDHCLVRGKVVELIQLSGTDSRQILTEMLVDDGLATRKRRHNLLDPDYQFIGIGVAPHSVYGYVTVIILAQEVIEGAERHQVITVEQPVLAVTLPSQVSMPSSRPVAIKHDEIRRLAQRNQQIIEPENNQCQTC